MTTGLEQVFAPSSVAVVGASNRPNMPGAKIVANLFNYGFPGDVFPMSIKEPEIQGHRAFPSIDALPHVPDLVVIAIDLDRGVDELEAYARAGTAGAVIVAAGGAEQSRTRIVEVARRHGMRILGPNCTGYADFGRSTVVSFSAALSLPDIPVGNVALVSQSGGIGSALVNRLADRGIGISALYASGDELDVTMPQLVDLVAGRADVSTLILYVESIRDGRALLTAIRRAVAAGQRVVTLLGGASSRGAQAAATHTGALATDARRARVNLEEAGAIVVDSLTEIVDIVSIARAVPAGLTTGARIGLVGTSGGGAVLATDATEAAGLQLATFQPATIDRLTEILPKMAVATNPLDTTAAVQSQPELLADAIRLVAEDVDVDVVVLVGITTSRNLVEAMMTASAAARTSGAPLVIAAETGSLVEDLYGRSGGTVPVVDGFPAALRAIARLTSRASIAPSETSVTVPQGPAPESSGPLGEDDSLLILEAHGLPIPRWCAVGDAIDAADLQTVGFPLVLKVAGADIFHKLDKGLLKVGIRDVDEATEALEQLRQAAATAGLSDYRIMAQEMVAAGPELLLGLVRDDSFGPMMTVGIGGSLAERVAITVLASAESAAADPQALIRRLQLPSALLTPEVADSLESCIRAVLSLDAACGGRLTAVDVNPLILGSARVTAVDAKVVVAPES